MSRKIGILLEENQNPITPFFFVLDEYNFLGEDEIGKRECLLILENE